MKKITIFAAAGAVFLIGSVLAAPAYADCTADIKEAEGQLAGASPQWPHYQKVVDMIEKAADKLSKGKKKKCQKIMVKAFRKLENVK